MRSAFAWQPELFDEEQVDALAHARFNGRSGAFGDNMTLPVHRWYRYSAGFSADWVRYLIQERCSDTDHFSVLDPFAGVGTTLLASEAARVRSWGFENHPFIHRVAAAKLRGIHTELSAIRDTFDSFLKRLSETAPTISKEVPLLLSKCYAADSLAVLFSMRDLFLAKFDNKTPESELLWLTLTSILRMCSIAGTAQWQYVLPNKSKVWVPPPYYRVSS